MKRSTIEQLSQSTFRDKLPHNDYALRVSKRDSAVDPIKRLKDSRGAGSLNELKDYVLQMPRCEYHHQPIRFLCVSGTCQCSTFGMCTEPECRKLHSDPDADIIEIDVFNSIVANNCSPMLLLARKIKNYFEEMKAQLNQSIHLAVEKNMYLIDNVYMGEVPRLIRQKKSRDITSSKLAYFLKRQISENSSEKRKKTEALRNDVVSRIGQLQDNLGQLYGLKQYQSLLLNDTLQPLASSGEGSTHVDVSSMHSKILEFKEEKQDLVRMLKQNRVPHFNRITTLFRASEHLFSAHEYHKAVEGRSPTVTLITTTTQAKFGVFLNCKITQRQEWICDASGLSFIFSLDRGQVFKLKPEAGSRVKAAFGGPQGPQIGSGCDLYLMDKCNKARVSGANLGGSYRLPPHLDFNSPPARAYLAGEQMFTVKQYQVFLLDAY